MQFWYQSLGLYLNIKQFILNQKTTITLKHHCAFQASRIHDILPMHIHTEQRHTHKNISMHIYAEFIKR